MAAHMKVLSVKPVPMVNVHTLGAEGNDVGLKAHHGGVDKAFVLMSDVSFPCFKRAYLVKSLIFTVARFTVKTLSYQAYMKIMSVSAIVTKLAPRF